MKTYEVSPDIVLRLLRCAEVMPGCQAVIEGRDIAETMARAMTHLIHDHGIAAPPFELVTKAHAAIRAK